MAEWQRTNCNVGDGSLNLGWEKISGEGNGQPIAQYSVRKNPMTESLEGYGPPIGPPIK